MLSTDATADVYYSTACRALERWVQHGKKAEFLTREIVEYAAAFSSAAPDSALNEMLAQDVNTCTAGASAKPHRRNHPCFAVAPLTAALDDGQTPEVAADERMVYSEVSHAVRPPVTDGAGEARGER